MGGVIPDEDAFERTKKAVHHFEGTYRNRVLVGTKKVIRRGRGTDIVEGILDGALTRSSNSGQTESTATLSVWKGKGDNWADTGDDVTVTNRHDYFEAKVGDYLICAKLSGEYRPIFTMQRPTCISELLSFPLDELTEETAPAHVLGINSEGCMVLVPITDCEA